MDRMPMTDTRAVGKRKPMTRGQKALAWIGGFIAFIAVIILILGLLNWNMLKPPIERIASAQMNRKVTIDGNLAVHILSWTPSATIEGIHIANPAWVTGGGDMTHIDKLSIQVRLLPLFHGQVIMPLLQVDHPNVQLLQAGNGDNNWTFGNPNKPKKPLKLPPIQRFEINDGQLKLDDAKRHLTFNGTVNSSEVQDGKNVQAFSLNGDGKLNGEDFTAKISGGPLLNVDVTKPYPFGVDIHAGPSHLAANGSITKPFDLGRFDTTLDLSGPDLNRLYYLTGLALPNTPPYAISGRLTRVDNTFQYTGLNGHLGSTDIHGQLGVVTGGARIMLTGDLASNKLKFEDLATVLGGAPAKSSPKSPDQVRVANAMAANRRLLPDATLQVNRLRGMDAKVKYVATTVTSETLPVRSASVNLVLDNGLLTLDPLVFGFSNGRIGGRLAINARHDIPAVDMDMRLSGAKIEQFMPAKFSGALTSTLAGRAKLSGSGLSVREAAGHATGEVTLVGSSGEIRDLFAQALGVNVVKSVGLLLSKNQQSTDLRCAIADFHAKDGLLTAQTLLIDTGPTLVRGDGTINLRDEQLDLKLKGSPKKPQLLHLNAPITVRGPLVGPKIGIEKSAAIGQSGIGVAIGVAINPLAALIPFLDPGDAKNVDCTDLSAKAAPPAPAPKVAKGTAPQT
jgi:uncharacterized protein involved in outer membrane biogenesis